MSDNRKSSGGIDEFIFEYSLFLITAARGTLDEPHTYGALRLIDAITRLTEMYSKFPEMVPDKFLIEVKDEIQKNLDNAMKSEENLTKFMDGLIVKFTEEMKRRYASYVDVAEG
jgi:hypothetical protein